MWTRFSITVLLGTAICCSAADAQDAPAGTADKSRSDVRYSLAVIEDATVYANRSEPIPLCLDQFLVEPKAALHYRQRLTVSTSLIAQTQSYDATRFDLGVKEAYAGFSAGDFDLMAGRRMVRWGTGYAFTAAGVLDPPRDPTNPSDRLNLNLGRDMAKIDWVRGPHALTAVWSTAHFAPAGAIEYDTAAFRYNVLIRGFDTAAIAGHDNGADSFGGLTFTRVVGEAWEIHGEAVWREQAAALMGAKYTLRSGITFLGEFYTPPNIPYYRDMSVSSLAGRQHYLFADVSKSRLRELPGWKEWDLGGYMVMNLNDRSFTAVFDGNRRFGNRFSAYVHLEVPGGGKSSDYGSAPYSAATSMGVRFQL